MQNSTWLFLVHAVGSARVCFYHMNCLIHEWQMGNDMLA